MALRYDIRQAVEKPKGTRVLVPIIQPSPYMERSYLAILRRLLQGCAGGIRDIIIPGYERSLIRASLTGDADPGSFDALAALIKSLTTSAVSQLSTLLGLEAKRHTDQWLTNAKKAFGIDLKGVVKQEGLDAFLEAAALRNAGLIKGLTDDLMKKVSVDVGNALVAGASAASLKESIKKSLNTSDSRARLIAQDQTSKLNADLNQKRHQEIGINDYIWRTSHDERVRPRHARLEGNQYKYDEPTGAEEGLPPGKPIRCRCTAQAVVDFDADEKPVKKAPEAPAVVGTAPQPGKKPLSEAQIASLAKAHAAAKAKGEAAKAKKAAEAAAAKAAKKAQAEAKKAAEVAAKKAQAEAKKAAEAAAKAATIAAQKAAKEQAAKVLAAQKAAAKVGVPTTPFNPTKSAYRTIGPDFPLAATPGNGKGSLESYVGSGYHGMNKYFRSGGQLAQEYRDRALALKAAIDRSPIPVDIKAWRGIGSITDMVPDTADVTKLLGATIEDKGFVSVAIKADVSERFAVGNNKNPPPPALMMEIRLRKGQKGIHVGRHGLRYDETEIVLPPGSKFRVIEAHPSSMKGDITGKIMDRIVVELVDD